jgi:hypothetical protein
VALAGGSSLSADLVYRCVGTTACTDLLDGLPLEAAERERCRGRGLPVQETLQARCSCPRPRWRLACACTAAAPRTPAHTRTHARETRCWPAAPQLAGQRHVYACGDCVDMPYERTAFLAELMANMVAANIRRQEAGSALLSFPGGACQGAATPPTVASISLSKWDGVLQFNGLVVGGLPAVLVKRMIEESIVRVARGSSLWLWFWLANEWLTVLAGRFLFRN